MKIGKRASPKAALRRLRGRVFWKYHTAAGPPDAKTRRGATLPARSRRMRTREQRPAYRSIFQNAALYGASSLPPPKSCVSPVMRSTAVPQPASKWAV